MARRRWVYVEGRGLVEVDPDYRPAPRAFNIIGDTIEPFKSMATGEHFTSKSRYRADIRARGYQEVGNEKAAFTAPPERPSDGLPEIHETASQLGIAT